MLANLMIILILGILFGKFFSLIKLPNLLGMVILGIIISPFALNLIDEKVLNISSELRTFALVIILTRAGLSLDINDLKKTGRSAILLCFLPACFEILGTVIFATKLLGISVIDALIMGSVVAAVSPAVIVPRMIKLMDEGYGVKKSIPQMMMAGASVDDVFVIVFFTSFVTLSKTGNISYSSFLNIPVSIFLGVGIGLIMGYILYKIFTTVKVSDALKVVVLLGTSFVLLEIQNKLEDIVLISGLLAVMSIGIYFRKKDVKLSETLEKSYYKLWKIGEVFLFVLVGATVDLNYVLLFGWKAVLLIFLILIFRLVGVSLCIAKTGLKLREKIFCLISYIPKATVQAAIGSIPLSMGLSSGKEILTVAVLSILITAPIGAIGIDTLYTKLLDK